MNNRKNIFLILTIIIVFPFSNPAFSSHDDIMSSCEKNAYDLNHNEDRKGPEIDLFNWLAHRKTTATIENGFIISFEKLPDTGSRQSDLSLYQEYLSEYTADNSGYPKVRKYRNLLLGKLRSDPKLPVVTHISEYHNDIQTFTYNPYADADGVLHQNSQDIDRGFEAGLSAMMVPFQTALEHRLKSGRFTHVFFMSMGWNNDQGVSLCRYRKLMQETKISMAQLDEPFRPLVVGVTWPSVWLAERESRLLVKAGHLGSVFNKANDADEIGVFYGNIIVNQIIPFANAKGLPFIVVGHSYGARLASRALFSRELLVNLASENGPDFALLLQPAYSAQRHMEGRGLEGYPYAPISGMSTKVFVTSSRKDRANPFAVWSRHFGGIQGLLKARRNPEIFRFIPKHERLSETIFGLQGAGSDRPTVIDATSFITEHNDIYDYDIGQILAAILTNENRP